MEREVVEVVCELMLQCEQRTENKSKARTGKQNKTKQGGGWRAEAVGRWRARERESSPERACGSWVKRRASERNDPPSQQEHTHETIQLKLKRSRRIPTTVCTCFLVRFSSVLLCSFQWRIACVPSIRRRGWSPSFTQSPPEKSQRR